MGAIAKRGLYKSKAARTFVRTALLVVEIRAKDDYERWSNSVPSL